MKKHVLRLMCYVLVPFLLSSSVAEALMVRVIDCYDGDTCWVAYRKNREKVRIMGIDAPEMRNRWRKGQPFSQESKFYLNTLVRGGSANMTIYGRDDYQRLLVDLSVTGVGDIASAMVEQGLAEVYTGKTVKNLQRLQKLERRAQKQKMGIWSLGDQYVSPREYRRQ